MMRLCLCGWSLLGILLIVLAQAGTSGCGSASGPHATGSGGSGAELDANPAGQIDVALAPPSTCNAGASPPPPTVNSSALKVWANEGEDKVTRDELRLSNGKDVTSRAWDGSKITLFGARNETVSFNLVLEAASAAASGISVAFDTLDTGCGSTIVGKTATGDGVYDYTTRDIELFYVRYLQIKGLSQFGYETYDELAVPKRLRRPYTVNKNGRGIATGGWTDRPDHDKFYPDIAVPLDLVPTFSIAAGQSQSIWGDIYIPSDVAPGTYYGYVKVSEAGSLTHAVPIELVVRRFTLPDTPSAQTMMFIGTTAKRYGLSGDSPQMSTILDRHVQMAHRHRISVLGADDGDENLDSPGPVWPARLDGTLFTAANGYRGPGTGVGNGIYAVGMYQTWGWQDGNAGVMATNADAWVTWFAANAPTTQYFIYLEDEPPQSDWPQDETWAEWIKQDPGPGKALKSFLTFDAPLAQANVPSVDIIASSFYCADTASYDAAQAWLQSKGKALWLYDVGRIASGTLMTDDDGVSPREIPWGLYKKGGGRFFHWESTVYQDEEDGAAATDVFAAAANYGEQPYTDDPVLGETSSNYTNGNGLLFYPGTDKLFPSESYGLNGPIASLRMKYWRRGITDIDYVVMAASKDAAATQAIVNKMVPKVLWEVGVFDQTDPTYQYGDVSWSTNPDDWEAARAALADIIEQ